MDQDFRFEPLSDSAIIKFHFRTGSSSDQTIELVYIIVKGLMEVRKERWIQTLKMQHSFHFFMKRVKADPFFELSVKDTGEVHHDFSHAEFEFHVGNAQEEEV